MGTGVESSGFHVTPYKWLEDLVVVGNHEYIILIKQNRWGTEGNRPEDHPSPSSHGASPSDAIDHFHWCLQSPFHQLSDLQTVI